jgi:hypothetical protein
MSQKSCFSSSGLAPAPSDFLPGYISTFDEQEVRRTKIFMDKRLSETAIWLSKGSI